MRRIWIALPLSLMTLVALYLFPIGIRNVIGLVLGKTGKSNFPGTIVASPAWMFMLPFVIATRWKRKIALQGCVLCGFAGAFGTSTMPCAWERINRFGLLSGTLLSLLVVALGILLLRYWSVIADQTAL